MAKKKKSEETELYYTIEKIVVIAKRGSKIVFQSGSPQPPTRPPKG